MGSDDLQHVDEYQSDAWDVEDVAAGEGGVVVEVGVDLGEVLLEARGGARPAGGVEPHDEHDDGQHHAGQEGLQGRWGRCWGGEGGGASRCCFRCIV